MSQRRQKAIEEYLQDKDVQERIQKRMAEARSEATVTIGRAAKLFSFSENQLRDWERRGWLAPQRPPTTKALSSEQDAKEGKKHRQYSLEELDKLALIRELMDVGYSAGDINLNIDTIENMLHILDDQLEPALGTNGNESGSKLHIMLPSRHDVAGLVKHVDMDDHAYEMYKDLFWKYYASMAMRLSLYLINEGVPQGPVALVLPKANNKVVNSTIISAGDLKELGESLIGWLGGSRTFYTDITDAPTFRHADEYRVFPLQVSGKDDQDNTWLILERESAKHLANLTTGSLNLDADVIITIQRLLAPLYENESNESYYNNIGNWHRYFGQGMRDFVLPSIDFGSNQILSDIILGGLANIVVSLGGKMANGQDRWRFCNISLPQDDSLPLQQRSLLLQARSKHSPYKVRRNPITPEKYMGSLVMRAYQSGDVIYRPNIGKNDATIMYQDLEGDVRSAIGIPVAAEDGIPAAVLYVVSDEENAFPPEAQRVLRMISRMVQELLLIYDARQRVAEKLIPLIEKPQEVDVLFENLLSENEFIHDVDALLQDVSKKALNETEEALLSKKLPESENIKAKIASFFTRNTLSFIAIDIDKQSAIATRYGDIVARNLIREVGWRIRGQLRYLSNLNHRRLYHMYADRYYLILDGMSLEEARDNAVRLKKALDGRYLVDARDVSVRTTSSPDVLLELPDVTVHLGVAAFPYWKVQDLKQRGASVPEVRDVLIRTLDELLSSGRRKYGGNCITTWEPEIWDYKWWEP